MLFLEMWIDLVGGSNKLFFCRGNTQLGRLLVVLFYPLN